MMYRRYGIIKLSDFASSLVLIFFLLGIGLFAYGIQLFAEGTIFIIATILSLLNIFCPCAEHFSISGNVITGQTIFRSWEIVIPPESVVVITQADVRPILGRQSFLLKERIAISILQDMSLENTVQLLHGNYQSQFMYTNSTIEKSVDEYKFVYSFVLVEGLLEKVLQTTKCVVVIPKSIKDKMLIDDHLISVYIDSDY